MNTSCQSLIKIQFIFLIAVQILCLVLHAVTLNSFFALKSEPIRYPGMNIKEF
jgi:hypothetical protein